MANESGTTGSATLTESMGITDAEIERRKRWLSFTEADEKRLQALNQIAEDYADPVIEDLYRHFLAFDETRSFFSDRRTLDRVKALQKAYFLRLTRGNYGRQYVEERLNVGAVHERIGLDVKWYLGAYSYYMRSIAERIFQAFRDSPGEALLHYLSLKKLVFMDIGFAIDTYIFQRERTIGLQQEAILELSTPVMQVREGLLILPIIGAIDSYRARQLTEALLKAIRANRAKVVVIDVTGVPSIDSKVANHLVQTVESSRLMGASVIVTGLSPEIAQTLVTIGVDLSKMNTVGDLQGGIEVAERLLGYRVVRTDEAAGNDR